MLKRVLIPIDDTPYSEAAIQYGFDLYHRHKCFLSAIAIVDVPGIVSATIPMGIGTSWFAHEGRSELLKEEDERARDVLSRFAHLCATEKIPNVDVEMFSAPVESILRMGCYFDLVLMGMGAYPISTEEDVTHTFRKVIHHTSAPVLGAPSSYHPIRRGMICFDGGATAAKALHLFALLRPYDLEDLTLLSVIEKKKDGEHERFEQLQAMASEFLHGYGFDMRQVILEGKPQQVIPDFAEQYKQDLIILGPHTKRVKEWFFGSVTNQLLQTRTKTLFVYD